MATKSVVFLSIFIFWEVELINSFIKRYKRGMVSILKKNDGNLTVKAVNPNKGIKGTTR